MDEKFTQAVQYITPPLREVLLRVAQDVQETVMEIRLRVDAPMLLVCPDGMYFLLRDGRICSLVRSDAVTVEARDIRDTFLRLCGYSVHSVQRELREGSLTVDGGHRAGLCGHAVTDAHGRIQTLSEITSINLRVARYIPAAAQPLWQSLFQTGLCSVIVAGPPASGKTTVLRDLARRLSQSLYRVSVIDSRGELGPLPMCDVFSGCGKAEGILCALRSMSPQMLICDEVASAAEIDALQSGFAAGVECAVSIHAGSEADLRRKHALQMLLQTGQFSHVVLLRPSPPGQIRSIYEAQALAV